jgi:hypothetical protein
MPGLAIVDHAKEEEEEEAAGGGGANAIVEHLPFAASSTAVTRAGVGAPPPPLVKGASALGVSFGHWIQALHPENACTPHREDTGDGAGSGRTLAGSGGASAAARVARVDDDGESGSGSERLCGGRDPEAEPAVDGRFLLPGSEYLVLWNGHVTVQRLGLARVPVASVPSLSAAASTTEAAAAAAVAVAVASTSGGDGGRCSGGGSAGSGTLLVGFPEAQAPFASHGGSVTGSGGGEGGGGSGGGSGGDAATEAPKRPPSLCSVWQESWRVLGYVSRWVG